MANDIEKLIEDLEAEIDDAVDGLSRAEYRDFLEDLASLVASRLAAVKEEMGDD